jgi:hypothetical protein
MTFNLGLAGVQLRDLSGNFVLTNEGVQYGFPLTITEKNVTVEIPALDTVIKDLSEARIEAKLDIVAGDTFMTPWTDTAKIEVPVEVSAVVEDIQDETEAKPKIDIKIVEEKDQKVEKPEVKITSKFGKSLTEFGPGGMMSGAAKSQYFKVTKANEKEYLKKAKEVTKDAKLTDKGIWFPSVDLKFAFVQRI